MRSDQRSVLGEDATLVSRRKLRASVCTHRSGRILKFSTHFFFHSFHQHGDLSEVHEPEADKADDLHFCPGDITVEKTAAHVMPWLRR